MAAIASVLLLALPSAGNALRLREQEQGPWHQVKDHSRPGQPDIEPTKWTGSSPYLTEHSERTAWGERLLKAATSSLMTEEQCGAFMSFGDFTWCAKAMPQEKAEAKILVHPDLVNGDGGKDPMGLWGPVLHPKHAEALQSLPAGDEFVGISFGIRERDPWSEFISNRYAVPTRLYDCYYNNPVGEGGPVSPNPGETFVPNATQNGVCPYWREAKCYGAPYEVRKVCVNKNAETIVTKEKRELKFETIKETLKDLKPLSAFLKVDIEGSEWDVLEQLLDNKEELAKVRTLDMEAHLKFGAVGMDHHANNNDSEVKERRVRIMERLTEAFAVVGSTFEWQHQSDKGVLDRRLKANPNEKKEEPQFYTKNGYSLDQYCISYVNRALL